MRLATPKTAAALLICLALSLVPGLWAQADDGHVGLPQDWSMRHVIYTNGATPEVAAASARDPRSWISWVRRTFPQRAALASASANMRDDERPPISVITKRPFFRTQIDWSVSLGTNGGVPLAETPAKYSFNTNGTPDCVNDFVVFVINATPGVGSQANIVALNNLYSGPPPNLCGTTPKWAGRTFTDSLAEWQEGGVHRSVKPECHFRRLDLGCWAGHQCDNRRSSSGGRFFGGLARLYEHHQRRMCSQRLHERNVFAFH
jgi:hypothetical protein